jgi:hypothetical protein
VVGYSVPRAVHGGRSCSPALAHRADRIIRLEEKLRFHALLPPDLLARSHSLSIQQIIALRFAADEELPGLVRRTLDENLSQRQVKQAINSWQPDYLRV